MNILDIIILIPMIFAVYKGITKGFVYQASEIAGIVIGIFLALRFSPQIATYIGEFIKGDPHVIKVISFILVLILVMLLSSLLARLISQLLSLLLLGWLNKILGVIFALVKVAIIIGALVSVIFSLDWGITNRLLNSQLVKDSVLLQCFQDLAQYIFPYLKVFISNSVIKI